MPGAGRRGAVRGSFPRGVMAAVVLVGLVVAAKAQVDPNMVPPQGGNEEVLRVALGRAMPIKTPWPTSRVAVTDPTIAAVQVLAPEQILVQGLKAGSTDLILWSEDGQQTWQRRILVTVPIESFREGLQILFPTARLQVIESEEVLVVQGVLRSADQAQQLHEYLSQRKISFVDMTSVAGVQQVQLQVRVAEVSRAALKTLGVNGFQTDDRFFFGQRVGSSSGGPLVPGINIGAAAGQTAGDNLDFVTGEGGIGASPLITLFAGFPNSDLEIFLQALAENQYMRLLANPTLVALSGEEANFLAGGEFPIPVVQGGSAGGLGSNAITIQYKEFGVRLRFRPVVLGDGGIRLYAIQEVSELTDVGAVVIQGFSVPGLIARRGEATLELKSGQSFAMAGLIQYTDAASSSRIPGLGDLPILGPLFRSVRYKNQETELVILVTASLVEPVSMAKAPPLPGVTYTAPNDWELYLEGRQEGKEPAKVDPATAQWFRDMGLDRLVGPGAWDSYGD
jgi:pilus assembly protein CpaC